jgi:hypothetical protein
MILQAFVDILANIPQQGKKSSIETKLVFECQLPLGFSGFHTENEILLQVLRNLLIHFNDKNMMAVSHLIQLIVIYR